MASSKVKTGGRPGDKDKVMVKLSRNLSVLLDPKEVTPANIERLKEKYAKCTGSVGSNFW